MAAPVSGFELILPIITFFLTFIIVYIVLAKLQMGNQFIQIVLSFLITLIVVFALGPRNYIQNIVPWFGVLLIVFFFVLVIVGFAGFSTGAAKPLGIIFVIIFIIIVILSAVFVFQDYWGPYSGTLTGSDAGRWWQALVFIVIAALVGWAILAGK